MKYKEPHGGGNIRVSKKKYIIFLIDGLYVAL